MRHLTVRNVPPELALALANEQQSRGKSLNQTILDLLSKALGVAVDAPPANGLEKLAGTWDEADLQSFEEATAVFEQIDEELWR
jgi:hypothetical protein